MKFKRISYHSGEGLAKIRIEDDTGRVIENWTIMMSDLPYWSSLIINKYGLNKKKDRDLDWAL